MMVPPNAFAFLLLLRHVSAMPTHAVADGGDNSSIKPYKIPFSALERVLPPSTTGSADAAAVKPTSFTTALLAGLANNGLVSVTDLPNNFKEIKIDLLSNLHACLMSIEKEENNDDGSSTVGNNNIIVPTEHLLDGTIRRSFATVTLPDREGRHHGGGGDAGPQPIHSLEQLLESNIQQSYKESCVNFRNHLDAFRSTVNMVTAKFAQQLTLELEPFHLPKPLLHSAARSETDEDLGGATTAATEDYQDFARTVAGGEHLEHFHSYQRKKTTLLHRRDVTKRADEEETTPTTTIDLHTDQGLFIAFTPGLLLLLPSSDVGDEEVVGQRSLQLGLSKGFVIQDSSGENHVVEFTIEDDLVFMMGDAVNQVINEQLLHGHTGLLRATPHALVLDTQDDDVLARVWYGRMVLPPNDAYSPIFPEYTFGKLRQSLVHSTTHGDDAPLGIGCSSPNLQTVIAATARRSLSEGGAHETTCAQDELFCWFGCMSLPEYNISSVFSCAERNLNLACMNPRGQVHENGEEHGDFFPACTNKTYESDPVTPFPTIVQQDEDVCTSELWTEFLMEESYDHQATLTRPNGTETILLWSIVDNDDGSKKLKARLVFDNVFGWLAIGFANQTDYILNGMLGGSVLLAMPGGNYDAATGMDLSVNGSVATYKISEEETAFRHWQTPIDNDETRTTVASFEDTDCFTALTFESDHINGQKFTLNGTDEMIWAGNHNDTWMTYHGPFDRARFVIDWNKDEGVSFSGDDDLDESETGTEPEASEAATVEGGVPSSGGSIGMPGSISLASAVTIAWMLGACVF